MNESESLRSQVEKQIVAMQKAQAQYKRQSPTWMCHSFIITELERVRTLIDEKAKEHAFRLPNNQVVIDMRYLVGNNNNQKEQGERTAPVDLTFAFVDRDMITEEADKE